MVEAVVIGGCGAGLHAPVGEIISIECARARLLAASGVVVGVPPRGAPQQAGLIGDVGEVRRWAEFYALPGEIVGVEHRAIGHVGAGSCAGPCHVLAELRGWAVLHTGHIARVGEEMRVGGAP